MTLSVDPAPAGDEATGAGPDAGTDAGTLTGTTEPTGVAGPPEDGPPEDEPPEDEVTLPERVRARVVALVAEALPALDGDELPGPLRPFARFTPVRRARLAGGAIAAQLAADPLFRQRVAARVGEVAGPLAAAVAAGTPPGAADPVEVAALAYLARPAGWTALVGAAAAAATGEAEAAARRATAEEVTRLTGQLERLHTKTRADAERLRAELAAARSETDQLRARVRELTRSLRDAEQEAKRAGDALATERGRAAASAARQDGDVRRLRSRLREVEAALDAARQAGKEGRAADETRLWLLLETISGAAQGLRRELAVSPPDQAPADLVAAATPADAETRAGGSWAADDPGRLDQLLGLPRVHLVVDGYNVTKTGYGDTSLEQQRTRLVGGLAGLAAQTNAEVTAVFDGAERLPVAPAAPRHVRVLFSRRGETADEVIRRLVRAEPPGRPVAVVSSDREVADAVRRAGAYPVPAAVLLRRLARA